MTPNDTDTIVARATPQGTAGVGIIRLSGPAALSIIRNCVTLPKTIPPNHVLIRTFKHPQKKDPIDKVCIVYYQSPKSYTGEDIVEIHCHSSPYVIKSILEHLHTLGARLALAGEFSKRAVIHGKLSLTQAESVIDLIHSETKLQHQVSLNRVEGKLLGHISSIRSELMHILEQIEGSIDFPDEVPAINKKETIRTLKSIQSNLQKILNLQDLGKTIAEGIHCVIVGKPNTGKSSLFNALLGEDRSIVTDTPGTTRDYISESITFNDIIFHLYDTAGIRDSTDTIEFLGIQKIQQLLKKADIILWTCDQSAPLTQDDISIYNTLPKTTPIALIQTKSDQPQHIHPNDLSLYPHAFTHSCSIQNPTSIQALKTALHQHLTLSHTPKDLEFLCNIRQHSCLKQLYTQLQALTQELPNLTHDDMLSIELRTCINTCSELTGDSLTEEILDGIFSRFCVGK